MRFKRPYLIELSKFHGTRNRKQLLHGDGKGKSQDPRSQSKQGSGKLFITVALHTYLYLTTLYVKVLVLKGLFGGAFSCTTLVMKN